MTTTLVLAVTTVCLFAAGCMAILYLTREGRKESHVNEWRARQGPRSPRFMVSREAVLGILIALGFFIAGLLFWRPL
jgi:hypothetical protein